MIKVYCEGETEVEYVRALKSLDEVRWASNVSIVIDPRRGRSPADMIDAAIKSRSQDGDADEYWCVFDVEDPGERVSLAELCDRARHAGIAIAVTNPCFELWLVLHTRDIHHHVSKNAIQQTCESICGYSAKHIIDPSLFLPLRHEAVRRARALRERHEAERRHFPRDNPSSTCDELLAAIGAAERAW